MSARVLGLSIFLCSASCLLPASERAELDDEVGIAEHEGDSLRVADGLATVHEFDGQKLTLWAQGPELSLSFRFAKKGMHKLDIDVLNCMRDSLLRIGDEAYGAERVPGREASCRFAVELSDSAEVKIGPPDGVLDDTFVFGVLSDIQRGVGNVKEIFERMNEDPELSFIVSTGDLANTGTRDELLRIQEELALLNVPFFSTVGNHEMGAPPSEWHTLFGLFNPHFTWKGVTFSLVDSGNATIDPLVYDRLETWLDDAKDAPHVVLTHVPPLDPVGLRGGGFRSRKEGAKFLSLLGKGRVDGLFLGHIHSYYAFSSAGVPTFLSGGGGAIQEQLDGIGRHYLRVRVKKGVGLDDVAIVRVD